MMRASTLTKINWAKKVLAETGGVMTIRQIFYQLVAKGLILNNKNEYKNLDRVLIQAREDGIIPWNDIVDRTREIISYPGWTNLKEYLSNAPRIYRRDKLQSQSELVELWVEKQALSGHFIPFARKYGINVVVGRGYQSGSALYEFCENRFKYETRPIYIAYFGDWDPSGLDIDRSFREKMKNNFGVTVDFKRYALTREDTLSLPHNYAKPTDTRFPKYQELYGDRTWELDALPQKELLKRIQQAIDDHVDKDLYESECDKSEEEKDYLEEIISEIN